MTGPAPQPVGTCCIVLHSHLPWLAHAGSWPVGEEWLYQAWADSYLPITDLLLRLAAEGRRDQLTLGMTPVLAAMLDDPYCLAEFGAWLANWRIRAEGAVVDGVPNAEAEGRRAVQALHALETRWSAGGSPVLRAVADSGVAEILGGPAAHPFLPLLDERVARAALEAGLEDATLRLGRRPRGIWAPECAYRPGLEQLYRRAGVTHFLVDGPTVGGETGAAYEVPGRDGAGSGVLAFPRDMEVSYRVWSPTSGYPGGPWYRDFHTFDHPSGLKPSRVTGHDVPPERKAPYDPAAAAEAVAHDVEDFVGAVVGRLDEHRASTGRPGLVVVAYDTELFGHWWHEGPAFLEAVLRRLPERGVRLSTLAGAGRGVVAGPRELPASSWGAGKDWHVWTDQADLTEQGRRVADRLLALVDKRFADDRATRDPRYDQLLREAFLTLSSDWAFLVSHGSSPDYAHRRADEHAARFDELADLLEADLTGRVGVGSAGTGTTDADELVRRLRRSDGPFGRLDARTVLCELVPDAGPVSDAGRGVTPMRALRVLMLSWEYPPVVHGGLGRHVEALATALTAHGVGVTVVAPTPPAEAGIRPDGPVTVLHPDPGDPIVGLTSGDLHGHVATLGTALARRAVREGLAAADAGAPFDVVCAHDWVVAQAAVTVAECLRLPLVATLHATEAGRHQGWLPGELSRSIHATEGWLTAAATRTVVCSESMRRDVRRLFGVPDEEIRVVSNGVDLSRWPEGRPAGEREPLVVFAGRLEYEKGVQVLLRAVPRLRRRIPGVRVVVAGSGTYSAELHALARQLRLGRAVRFTGRLADDELGQLYGSAAAVVVPSIYEPFGLVALEAAACGAPLVVAEVGGLAEFADGGRTAAVVAPDDVASLADGITAVLRDREFAEKLATSAREAVEAHDWGAVARRTAAVYAEVARSPRRKRRVVPEPPAGTNLLH